MSLHTESDMDAFVEKITVYRYYRSGSDGSAIEPPYFVSKEADVPAFAVDICEVKAIRVESTVGAFTFQAHDTIFVGVAARLDALKASALAKLTNEERVALGLT